jgi:hypothetical protein
VDSDPKNGWSPREAAKAVVKETTKAAAKSAVLGAAKSGARQVAARIPAGASQLQFEITALFALAVADIHGKDYDQEQAHALVYGLSNGRVSQKQIAMMASDLAQSSNPEIVSVSQLQELTLEIIEGGSSLRKVWAEPA